MSESAEITFQQARAASVASIRRTFADHIPLYVVSAVFVLAAISVTVSYRLPLPLESAVFFLVTIALFACVISGISGLFTLGRMYFAGRPDRPLVLMGYSLLRSALSGDRPGNIFHGLVTFTPLMVIFAALKVDIARIHPFSWDEPLMRVGLVLGFGRHFWQILQPIFGHPVITAMLSIVYALWFLVMFGCLSWQLTSARRDPKRMQFLLAYAFAWFFGGFVIATVFSSAGPWFYGHVAHGPNPYTPLLKYLYEANKHWPVWTVEIQQELWHSYLTGTGDIQGISAMPSMHVTIAVLLALFGWTIDWRLGSAFTVFAIMIFLASILLGWHYVADSMVGAGLAVIFWRTAEAIVFPWSAYLGRRAAQTELADQTLVRESL